MSSSFVVQRSSTIFCARSFQYSYSNKCTTKICNPLLIYYTLITKKRWSHDKAEQQLNEFLKRNKDKLGEVIEPNKDGIISMNSNGMFTDEEIRKMIDEADEEIKKKGGTPDADIHEILKALEDEDIAAVNVDDEKK